ncbi:MAG TPA: hypothetical protein VM925_17055 [Labilithrix sp.]|nr:hypothetical protein [Labilithrix sp.]
MIQLKHILISLIGAVATDEAIAEAGDAGAPAPALPACVQVKTESRYVPYGYNHIVTLTSGCGRPATCTVATDVNPETRSVDLPPSTSVQVTTFMGAAASTFTAKVACTLR